MENKEKNIDINKNKELFEYEMTEVILNLKEEFKVFSGKNTKFEEINVDNQDLAIDIKELPELKTVNLEMNIPEVPKNISFDEKKLGQENSLNNIKIPEIKKFNNINKISKIEKKTTDREKYLMSLEAPSVKEINKSAKTIESDCCKKKIKIDALFYNKNSSDYQIKNISELRKVDAVNILSKGNLGLKVNKAIQGTKKNIINEIPKIEFENKADIKIPDSAINSLISKVKKIGHTKTEVKKQKKIFAVTQNEENAELFKKIQECITKKQENKLMDLIKEMPAVEKPKVEDAIANIISLARAETSEVK